MAPELVKEFIAEFTAEANRYHHDRELQLAQRRRELSEVARRLDGLIDAIADGLRTAGLKDKLEELERRKRTLETELTTALPPPPLLHPNLAELYRRKIAELENAIEDPTLRDEALAILRDLVEAVELHPTKDGFDIEFRGQIANMIGLSSPTRSRSNSEHFVISAKRVAGERSHLYRTIVRYFR